MIRFLRKSYKANFSLIPLQKRKERKKMQNGNKFLAILIALLLTISTASSILLIPNANAHTPGWQIPTYAYIVAVPDPVGVGQPATVYMWLDAVYGAAGGASAAQGGNGSTASAALLSNNYRFQNFNLTIVAPDGTKTTQIFATISDPTSSQYYKFTPDQLGTYTLVFNYPGQVYGANGNGYEKSTIINDNYLPSSASASLTVQQTPIPDAVRSYPLPTQYWTRPIYGENTDWWTISSNWLGIASPAPSGVSTLGANNGPMFRNDAIGPLTSHVMWTLPLQFGGVVGGNQFRAGGSDPNSDAYGVQYFEGSSYAPRFYSPIIMNGVLFYTQVASFTGSPTSGGSATGPTVAIDLRTGKQLWSNQNIPQITFGYIYNLWNPDQHGVYPPILGASVSGGWNLYDAYTGLSLFNVTGLPTGTAVMGPSGEHLRYSLTNTGTSTNPAYYLSEWNSSRLWIYDVNPYTGGGSLSPSIINASNGALITQLPIPITGETASLPTGSVSATYGSSLIVNANIPINSDTLGATGKYATPITTFDWNVSASWANTMSPAPTIIAANYGDILLCRNGTLPSGFAQSGSGTSQGPYNYFAVNLNASKGNVGSVIWSQTYNPPAGNLSLVQGPFDFQNRVFTFNYIETMQWAGYSMNTGQLLWTTPSETAFNYYDWVGYNPGVIAYGKLFSGGFGGVLYAYNDLTGKIEWTYGNGGGGNSTNAGLNVFYGNYPSFVQAIGNGVVYYATDEHTMPNPFYKGATARAINATTGEEIWQLSGYASEWAYSGQAWAIADGYATMMNGLDNNIYSVGKGPSVTTIQAPQTQITVGNKVVIQGTVMDISAGTTQTQQAADFPHGVPVASDASMKDWMGYVYQQKPLPSNFTGVPVSINAIDPNGNTITLGSATTDTSGKFHYTWTTPNVPGDYSVFATFAGTNGYWPSSDKTAMTVTEAPQATTAPTVTPASQADMYFLPASIAIILAIVIVGVVLALLTIRKRP
jgi:hypothetical protein